MVDYIELLDDLSNKIKSSIENTESEKAKGAFTEALKNLNKVKVIYTALQDGEVITATDQDALIFYANEYLELSYCWIDRKVNGDAEQKELSNKLEKMEKEKDAEIARLKKAHENNAKENLLKFFETKRKSEFQRAGFALTGMGVFLILLIVAILCFFQNLDIDIAHRLMVFVPLLYGMHWCSRLYLSAKHREYNFEEKQVFLKTFRYFNEAGFSDNVKNTMTEQVMHTVFSPTHTGLVKDSGDINVTEVIKNMKGS